MALHAARARATPAFLYAYVEFTVPYMYSIMYWYCLQGSIRVRTALPGGGRDDRKIRFHPNQSSSEICQLNWLMSDTVSVITLDSTSVITLHINTPFA